MFWKGVLVDGREKRRSIQPTSQASRQQLFDFVESEFLAIENSIATSNDYGRANKAVVRMLLAKLYLNAEVYTGTAHIQKH